MYRSAVILFLGLLILPAVTGPAETEEPVKPGMDAYYQWLLDNVDAIEKDLPEITEVATKAAERYVTGDWGLKVAGSFGIMAEAVGRSGGFMAMKWGYPPKFQDREKTKKFIVLLALREGQYDDHLEKTKKNFAGSNTYLIAMGPEHLLKRARKDDMPVDASFAIHDRPSGGLFDTGNDKTLVRTTTVASIAALWAWTAEFVAACTRKGKMPVMHQSFTVEGAKERAEKMKGQRFESEAPDPIKSGTLGQRYLKRLRENLHQVYSNGKKTFRKAVKRALRKRKQGGTIYAFLTSHSIVRKQLEGPHTPGLVKQLNKKWHQQKEDIELTGDDFVLCVGYDGLYSGEKYQHWARKARESGATLVWSFTDYNEEDVKNVREAGELFINQHWDFGDAEVEVPGYPYNICPTSGHVALSVLRLFQSGLLAQVRGESDGGETNTPDENDETGATEPDDQSRVASKGAKIGSVGHYLSGNQEVQLYNPDGRAFQITVHRYNWPFEGSWNKRTIKVEVTGPEGNRVLKEAVKTNEEGATLDVPADREGTYSVNVNAANTLNYWNLTTTLPRAVVRAGPGEGQAYKGENWFFGAPMVPRTWYFWVPEGTDYFTLKAQSGPARSQREDHGLIVRSPRGQPMAALWDQPNPTVKDGEIVAGRDTLRHQKARIVVEPGSDGRFWSVEVRLGGAHQYTDVNLALEGIPPYVSHSPETWFNPVSGTIPEPSLYDDDPFVRSDVPPDDERERPYFHYWMPCPAVGDPDGNEIRTPARLAMWNPKGRDLKWVLRSYIIRHQQAIKRGEREPEQANVQLSNTSGETVLNDQAPFHPEKNYKRTLDFQGVRFIKVSDVEHFWTYTYPAVPTVLVGTELKKSWHRFRMETGSLRHWYFRVPDGTETFEVRMDALNDSDVVALDVCAPDRRVARMYGNEGTKRIQVPEGTDDRIWHLRVDVGDTTKYVPPGKRARFPTIPFDLDLRGVPPFLAPTWEQWFHPRLEERRPGFQRGNK